MQAPQHSPVARYEDRHSHIAIRLAMHCDGQWEELQALGWNDRGFNFYSERELRQTSITLKRGLLQFESHIVWSALNTNVKVVEEALLNKWIFNKLRDADIDNALRGRLIRLSRTQGLASEKRKVLSLLGLRWSESQLTECIEQRHIEHPLHHYGVQVASDVWRSIVQRALSVSSVVVAMEKWSDALTGS